MNAALARLGRDPRDVDALVEAGDAASAMGDHEAAIGFFKRASQIASTDARVTAGLAVAHVLNGDPFSAIPLFAQAERAGADPAKLSGNRGLAYDLVGDNATAQRYYRLALAEGKDDEVRRRLALSQAIAGDARGVETTLMPLLREQDKAAWRARAFALAILGKTEESVEIANTILPAKLAQSITPYLRYMPRLTPAQQAAAANLGKFPRASEIGRDDPRIAQYVPKASGPTRMASAGERLAPQGRPLGSDAGSAPRRPGNAKAQDSVRPARERNQERAAADQAARVAPPEPRPARQTADGSESAIGAANSADPPVQSQASAGPAVAPPASSSAPARAALAAPESAVQGRRSPPLADVFSDLGAPSAEPTPVAGAVDIRRIEAAKPKVSLPEPEKKPPPPSHPSRIWVQLGIGQDKSALAFDWRKLNRKAPDAFRNRKAYVSELGRTNRMLTGPFESMKAANSFIAEIERAGIDGPYVWTSPAGQVVDAL